MGRGSGGLEAAPLVDRDVDQHRPRLHRLHQCVGDQRRRPGPGHQDGPDDQVRVQARPLDLVGTGGHGLQVALVDPVGGPQPLDVAVQQQDLGLHPERQRRSVHARYPGAQHDHLGRVDPRHPAHEHPPATCLALQAVGSHLGGHPACHLAHRVQQRQGAVGQLDRLVGDRGHTRGQDGVGEHPRSG